ncbi:RnfABCDGE type electron transport complex subunit D [Candidatus Woesearchaeota archaeon]|nr:RnfABCDGE type electron transport complex subunit D [Candidatus Woesearchaeota archaeon]
MDIKSLTNRFTIYHYMIFFLIILHLVSVFFYDFGFKALTPVLIIVITAIILDLVIEHFKYKTWSFPQSALISGLFIGGLLTQNLQWYVYVLAGIIAIVSKHLIKFQQKHIFNPANFGVLLVSIFFGASHTWWISSPLILVLIFGIFVIWRLKRFDLTISFLVSYFVINSIIELFGGSNFNDIFLTLINGGVIYFFSMYMLIEPRTNPTTGIKQRIIYGILVAIVFIILHFYIPRHDLPLALAVGNVFVPILNRFKFER